jgi:hypothetical protein
MITISQICLENYCYNITIFLKNKNVVVGLAKYEDRVIILLSKKTSFCC